jgi:ring-1,2-phenylacetyl-CoA epoxidase subunit PaaD
MATMRADLLVALRRNGFDDVRVDTVLSPAWSSDWISARGRAALADAGIAPPRPGDRHPGGPVAVTLLAPRTDLACPQCGSTDTTELSRFGSTACKSLQRCRSCGETFDHFKEI